MDQGLQFNLALAANASSTEVMLDRLLGFQNDTAEHPVPERLKSALRYATLGAGKRIRPFLVIETAKLFGIESEALLRVAASLEMIHCYSLVHDDLPAMDDDDIRRGQPTLHKAYDDATAILTGDALLTYAFEVIASPDMHISAQMRCELIVLLAKAAGPQGMVGGQMLDLLAEKAREALTQAEIETLQAMKTGALLQYAVMAGGLLGGCGSENLEKLAHFGRNLGAAFQIADDILDFDGDAAVVGKKIGKDSGRNKATLVSILGLEAARAHCSALAEQAKGVLRSINCEGSKDILLQSVDFIVSRQS